MKSLISEKKKPQKLYDIEITQNKEFKFQRLPIKEKVRISLFRLEN